MKMNLKKTAIVFTTMMTVGAVLLGTSYHAAVASNPLDTYKAKLKAVAQDANQNKAVYDVEGVTVTKGQLAKSLATAQSRHDMLHDGKTTSEQEALNVILSEIAVATQAKQYGLAVTDQEAKDWVATTKAGFEQHATDSDRQLMANIVSSMGLTANQYWNEFMPTEGKKVLLKGKLAQVFSNGYMSTHSKADQKEVNTAFDQYVTERAHSLKVTKKN